MTKCLNIRVIEGCLGCPANEPASVLKIQKGIYVCFIIKVARPISFNDLSLYRFEMNYEHLTMFQL